MEFQFSCCPGKGFHQTIDDDWGMQCLEWIWSLFSRKEPLWRCLKRWDSRKERLYKLLSQLLLSPLGCFRSKRFLHGNIFGLILYVNSYWEGLTTNLRGDGANSSHHLIKLFYMKANYKSGLVNRHTVMTCVLFDAACKRCISRSQKWELQVPLVKSY